MGAILDVKWMIVPLLACLVLSGILIYLGLHVIARKVIFVDLALAQIAALGATYALTLGYDPNDDTLAVSLFSLAFTFVGAGAFAITRMRREKVPQEAFIGIIYAAASAAAILALSKSATGGEELKHMLVGDILLVSLPTVIQMAILYVGIGIFHFIFRKKFLAISLAPARTERPCQRLGSRRDSVFLRPFVFQESRSHPTGLQTVADRDPVGGSQEGRGGPSAGCREPAGRYARS